MRAHNEIAGASHLQTPRGGDDQALDPALTEVAAQMLRHLADPTRFALLRLLGVGDQDVSTLTTQVAASRSSVSQHLGRLRLAGLVTTRRDGRRVVYAVSSDHVHALVAEAAGFAQHLIDGTPHHRNR
ncbi:MAG: ArsR/SmtB family transcription factor [Actinomycetes bacterium]